MGEIKLLDFGPKKKKVGNGLYLANPETLPSFPSSAGDYQNALMTFGTWYYYFFSKARELFKVNGWHSWISLKR